MAHYVTLHCRETAAHLKGPGFEGYINLNVFFK